MNEFTLFALSPLDGRYAAKCDALRSITSEFGLFKYRLHIEITWLIQLLPTLTLEEKLFLEKILQDFNIDAALRIKEIEMTTKHDVKAVEYYLKEKMQEHPTLSKSVEWVHFACTSEDINNLSYALMLKHVLADVIYPRLDALLAALSVIATTHAALPMLSRTHGQAASPTTLGKEFANVIARIRHQLQRLQSTAIPGKINGAVGNFNAHIAAFPKKDWIAFSKNFVEHLGLTWQPLTTQIEPHDQLAESLQHLSRINTICIDLCRDIWGYISLGYFTQQLVAGEVGSSTMPHKINPIDFENAEGNLGLANAMAHHLAEKLPISRFQRDLTDSTVLRNLGVVFGYSDLAYQMMLQGLQKLAVNPGRLQEDLNNNWEVLGEAVQTVMRHYGINQAYEQLKTLTRGKKLNKETLHAFIDTQPLPDDVKHELKNLTPGNYIGLAVELVERFI